MDADVLQLVSGMDISELSLQPAVVHGFNRRLVQGESFPVLVTASESSVSGLLVWGLSDTAMRRTQFFEGEEYILNQIQVYGLPGSHASMSSSELIDAVFFADNGVFILDDKDWSFHAWRVRYKDEFIQRLTSYMGLFGSLNTTDADQYW